MVVMVCYFVSRTSVGAVNETHAMQSFVSSAKGDDASAWISLALVEKNSSLQMDNF